MLSCLFTMKSVQSANKRIPLCLKVLKKLREDNSGLQIITREAQQVYEENERTARTLKCKKTNTKIHRSDLLDSNWHIPDLVPDI